jgi:hypothetical protein
VICSFVQASRILLAMSARGMQVCQHAAAGAPTVPPVLVLESGNARQNRFRRVQIKVGEIALLRWRIQPHQPREERRNHGFGRRNVAVQRFRQSPHLFFDLLPVVAIIRAGGKRGLGAHEFPTVGFAQGDGARLPPSGQSFMDGQALGVGLGVNE